VYERTVDSALNCTYYRDGNRTSPGVNITFGGASVSDPTAAAPAWKAHLNAFPLAVLVPGIGDGAVHHIASAKATAFNFISDGIACNMCTSNFK
jgi:hypothetical protein